MWVVCRLSVFCEPFTDRAFGFPYILFFYIFYIHFLHSFIHVLANHVFPCIFQTLI